jgi:hypothetical protein
METGADIQYSTLKLVISTYERLFNFLPAFFSDEVSKFSSKSSNSKGDPKLVDGTVPMKSFALIVHVLTIILRVKISY